MFFETNNDVVKVASLSRLDELVLILRECENGKLAIEVNAVKGGAGNLSLTQKTVLKADVCN